MRISPEIVLAASGDTGFSLTAPLDCNVFAIDGGSDAVIIDAGLGGPHGDTDGLLRTLERSGISLDRVSRLLLTHYHADHAGGAAEVQRALGVTVHGSPVCAQALSIGDEDVISLPFAKAAGFYPEDYVFEPCPTEASLVEGTRLTVGNLQITVYETPGHSAGHVSFLVEGGSQTALVAGDLIFYGGTVIVQNIPDCSIHDYAASTKKVADLDFEAYLPGHFVFSLQRGKRHVEAAARQFGRLMIPKNAF